MPIGLESDSVSGYHSPGDCIVIQASLRHLPMPARRRLRALRRWAGRSAIQQVSWDSGAMALIRVK